MATSWLIYIPTYFLFTLHDMYHCIYNNYFTFHGCRMYKNYYWISKLRFSLPRDMAYFSVSYYKNDNFLRMWKSTKQN